MDLALDMTKLTWWQYINIFMVMGVMAIYVEALEDE